MRTGSVMLGCAGLNVNGLEPTPTVEVSGENAAAIVWLADSAGNVYVGAGVTEVPSTIRLDV